VPQYIHSGVALCISGGLVNINASVGLGNAWKSQGIWWGLEIGHPRILLTRHGKSYYTHPCVLYAVWIWWSHQLFASLSLFDVLNANSNRKADLANWLFRRGRPMPTWLVCWALVHLAIWNAWVWLSHMWPVLRLARLSNCRHCGIWICGQLRSAFFFMLSMRL